MRYPKALENIMDIGLIDKVIRPLQSGKEAQVYLVESQGSIRVAKVYKEATNRSFKHRSEYVEGRKVRNSRQQRAMERKSKFGRSEMEEAWKSMEEDVLRRLYKVGIPVPTPYEFVEGVLLMELIKDSRGNPAPRLVDVRFSPRDAEKMLKTLVHYVAKMLCEGIVHGDLSDFNILIGSEGPIIIDFPQATDPASNNNAKKLLLRDVKNITFFLGRFNRRLKKFRYGPEMWSLYENGKLTPETKLTGRFVRKQNNVDTNDILREIQAAAREEAQKRERLGLSKYAKKAK
jgi:RIO kinase 1